MADEVVVGTSPPVPTPVKEEPQTLRDALGRATVPIVDADGITHQLPALRIRDIQDLEEEIGGMPNFMGNAHQIDHAITVIWLSARNEGLTKEQRLARAWKYTREDVGDMFVMPVPIILALASDILRNSGFVIKVTSGPLADVPAKTTGESSSPAA